MGSPVIEITKSREIIEISTTITNHTHNTSIDTTTDAKVEISSGYYTGTVVYASDIIGIDNYIQNFLDLANIDCGTP